MSQNLRVALYVPESAVAVGDTIVSTGDSQIGEIVSTDFRPQTGGTGGGNLPAGQKGIFVQSTPPSSPQVGDTWIDISNLNKPLMKVFTNTNTWALINNVPKATKKDQILISGPSPQFNWAEQPGIDHGRY